MTRLRLSIPGLLMTCAMAAPAVGGESAPVAQRE